MNYLKLLGLCNLLVGIAQAYGDGLNKFFYEPVIEAHVKGGHRGALGSMAAFIPLQATSNGLWFAQILGQLDQYRDKKWNIGLAYRHRLIDSMVSAYGVLDGRLDALDYHHSRLVFGVEWLNETLAARVNGYMPITRVIGSLATEKAQQSSTLLTSMLEKALSGLDVEVGANLSCYKNLQGFVAYYHFNPMGVKSMQGIRLRGGLDMTNHLKLTGETGYDRLRRYYWSVGLVFKCSLGALSKQNRLTEKMTQLIISDTQIITSRYISQSKHPYKHSLSKIKAIDAKEENLKFFKPMIKTNNKVGGHLKLPYSYRTKFNGQDAIEQNFYKPTERKSIEIDQFIAPWSVQNKVQSIIMFSSKEMYLKPKALNNLESNIKIFSYDIQGVPLFKDLSDFCYFINCSYWCIYLIGHHYGIKAYPKGLGGMDNEPKSKRVCLDHIENKKKLINIDMKLGDKNFSANYYKKARTYYKQALKMQKNIYGEQNFELVDSLAKLGAVELALKNYEKARSYYLRALTLQINRYGEMHIKLVETLMALGSIELNLKNYEESKINYEKALVLQRSCYNEDQINIDILLTLGRLESALNQHEKAKEYYSQAITLQTKRHGERCIESVTTLIDLGSAALALKRYEEAKAYYTSALIVEQNYPQANPIRLANIFLSLGAIKLELKQYKESKNHYMQFLVLYKESDQENYIVSFNSILTNLGFIEHQLGYYEAAKNYYNQAQRCAADAILVGILYHLGTIELKLKNYTEARNYYNQFLNITVDPLKQADGLAGLGTLEFQLAQYKEAKVYYEKSLVLKRNYSRTPHMSLTEVLINLGISELKLMYYSEADKHLGYALTLFRKLYSMEPNISLVAALLKLAARELSLGHYGIAQNYYSQILELQNAYPQISCFEVAETLVNLGIIALKLKNYNEAKQYYDQVLAIFRNTWESEYISILMLALSGLGAVEAKLSHHENAKYYYLDVLRLQPLYVKEETFPF